MNNPEAKFILSAYRPDGRDATDPAFHEALNQARHDPGLGRWLEQEREFDAAVTAGLQQVAPPPGLKEAILAGARASSQRPRRPWSAVSRWLAAAAAIALGATWYSMRETPSFGPEFAEFALRDLADAHDSHTGAPAGLRELQTRFASAARPIGEGLRLSHDEWRRQGCRTVTFQGREVFEICIQRDGKWFHLYAARRTDRDAWPSGPAPIVAAKNRFASAVWHDGDMIYALVTNAGPDALRRLI